MSIDVGVQANNSVTFFPDVKSGALLGTATRDRFANRGDGGYSQVSAVGGRSVGVFTSSGVEGEEVGVMVRGMRTVDAGAAVDDGDDVMSDGSGQAITFTDTGGHLKAGVAFSAATALGQKILVLI